MKKFLVVMLGLFCLSASALADSAKVAVVNLQQVLRESPQMQKVNTDLRKEFASREKKLVSEQNQLRKAVQDFNKNSAVMAKEKREKAQKNIAKEQENFAEMQQKFQQDLIAAQNKKIKRVIDEVKAAVAGVAKKNNYSLVLAQSSVVYAKDDHNDITNMVMKALGMK